ncbi:dihydroxyacetone phosphate acyltransferase isoform X2 [Pseudoliparis swirei]|uniref:dihydroxyacetone phosphate acyltransferase isoform X2 n=1 Tax=Pseudoliparis swirei TaxID=2059687 RepID=UPI0024BE11A0|nr:dihydroxyacetone phosphate acyltransferase isoform X2 [Pseudoliparis swirei]
MTTSTCQDSGGAGPEGFVDILEERRLSSDLGHALRTFSPSPYKGGPSCSATDLPKIVLESQYLRYVFKEIAAETGCSLEEVREDASVILEEMSQNLQLGFIRLMGYVFSKVFKRLFTSINVNIEGLNALQQAIQETPVILMPNHRSYVDFLVISYIMFTYDIPVPVIAAGIPLAGMKIVGAIIRRSGAFFIRRAIGSDKLYWAVLSEYVRTIIKKGFAPLEFYVEGLRSRTLKSLMPKLGMMHMVLEPYFKGEVYDIQLVPISISYDRVLEESLLAHELLGVSKPKESTTALLKASKVLQDDYGVMHVNFCRPMSVRRLCRGKINLRQYNLTPSSPHSFCPLLPPSLYVHSQRSSSEAQRRGRGLRELAGSSDGPHPRGGLSDQPVVSDGLPVAAGSARRVNRAGPALASAHGKNHLAPEAGAGLRGSPALARTSPRPGCDVVRRGSSSLRGSPRKGARLLGSGERAREETPRRPRGGRDRGGGGGADGGVLQEPVGASLCASRHARDSHERHKDRAERRAVRLLLLPTRRLLQRIHLHPREVVSGL